VGCKSNDPVKEPEQLDENIVENSQPVQEESDQEKNSEIELNVVKIPDSIISNCIGFLSGDPEESASFSEKSGAWVRPHIGPFVWDNVQKEGYRETDMWVKSSGKNQVAILATVWPYSDKDQARCHATSCKVSKTDTFYPTYGPGLPISRCAPCDYEDYKEFLVNLVERYDGDGIDDMKGLTIPIKYWEIMNEPEMKEDFLTFFKGSKEDYVKILKISNEVIKETCPDCVIVQGGSAGSFNTISYWRDIFKLNGDEYFDIANVHYINHGDLATLNVKEFKKLMDEFDISKPIWVTEVEWQTDDHVSVVRGSIEAGASKFFLPNVLTEWVIDGNVVKEDSIDSKDKKDDGVDYTKKEDGVDYTVEEKNAKKTLSEQDKKSYLEILHLCP